MKKRKFEDLPEDSIGEIARHLPYADVSKFRRTCRSFKSSVDKLGPEFQERKLRESRTLYFRSSASSPPIALNSRDFSRTYAAPMGLHIPFRNRTIRASCRPGEEVFSAVLASRSHTFEFVENRTIVRGDGNFLRLPIGSELTSIEGDHAFFDAYGRYEGTIVDLSKMTFVNVGSFYSKEFESYFSRDGVDYGVRCEPLDSCFVREGTDGSLSRFYNEYLSIPIEDKVPKLSFATSDGKQAVFLCEVKGYDWLSIGIAPFNGGEIAWYPIDCQSVTQYCRLGDDVFLVSSEGIFVYATRSLKLVRIHSDDPKLEALLNSDEIEVEIDLTNRVLIAFESVECRVSFYDIGK